MPDLEKVIKGLEMCIKDIECTGCPYEGECFDAIADRQFGESMMRDALALLKEQEAVEPIPFFTETGAESPNYVICGHCKSIKAIMPKHTKQKYCHECGFPVLWEGRQSK